MIPGIEIKLGDRALIIPPLNLAAIESLQDRLEAFRGGVDRQSVATVVDATFAALHRNYPDITREFITEFVDVANMKEVMEAVMDVGGLRRKAVHEGNRQAVAVNGSTGQTSTAT